MNRVFYIAGVQFRPAVEVRKAAEQIKVGDLLVLAPEPTNKYDPNAIKILVGDGTGNGTFLGYVPKKFSAEVSAMIEAGLEIECVVETINPQAKPWDLCRVRIKTADEPDEASDKTEEGDK
jgi:hypothetical protein